MDLPDALSAVNLVLGRIDVSNLLDAWSIFTTGLLEISHYLNNTRNTCSENRKNELEQGEPAFKRVY